MFGHDPELPDGFQDADFEMRALEEEGNRFHREEKKKKEPTFGTKDFGNGAWGQLNNLKGKDVKEAWDLCRHGVWSEVKATGYDSKYIEAFNIIDNAIRKGGD